MTTRIQCQLSQRLSSEHTRFSLHSSRKTTNFARRRASSDMVKARVQLICWRKPVKYLNEALELHLRLSTKHKTCLLNEFFRWLNKIQMESKTNRKHFLYLLSYLFNTQLINSLFSLNLFVTIERVLPTLYGFCFCYFMFSSIFNFTWYENLIVLNFSFDFIRAIITKIKEIAKQIA